MRINFYLKKKKQISIRNFILNKRRAIWNKIIIFFKVPPEIIISRLIKNILSCHKLPQIIFANFY